MSKAEKFIEDYTRKCSNEISSPYPQINNDVRKIDGEPAKEFSPWLTPDQARTAVEIAREEMIEKFCNLLNKMIWEITYEDLKGNSVYNHDKVKFINDLKQAVNEE